MKLMVSKKEQIQKIIFHLQQPYWETFLLVKLNKIDSKRNVQYYRKNKVMLQK